MEEDSRCTFILNWVEESVQAHFNDEEDSEELWKHYSTDEEDSDPSHDWLSSNTTRRGRITYAEGLSDVLGRCQVCRRGCSSAMETLQCLQSHHTHICLLCFKGMDSRDRVLIVNHYRRKGHFRDDSDFLVDCPFSNKGCRQICEYFVGLKVHILEKHLPITLQDPTTHRVKQRRDSLKESNIINVILGIHDHTPSNSNDGSGSGDNNSELSPSPRHNSNSTGGLKEKNFFKGPKGSESMDTFSNNKDSNFNQESIRGNFQQGTNQRDKETLKRKLKGFSCQFCWKKFPCQIGLDEHKYYKRCSWMGDKSCGVCGNSFKGYSLLRCIQHLINCFNYKI